MALDFQWWIVAVGLGTLVGSLVFYEFGRRLGIRALKPDREGEGVGAVEAALFALLGLLIAFTFSGAAARFDVRRELITQEANAIGSAYQFIDVLPAEKQAPIRAKFREYLDSRLNTFRDVSNEDVVAEETARTAQLQNEIWQLAVEAVRASDLPPTAGMILHAINEMSDFTTTRQMAAKMHPPTIIFVLLVVLIFASAVLAGFGTARARTRSWLHLLTFATIMGLTVYVIIDIEYPRYGFIKLDAFDEVLISLRDSIR